MSSTQRKVLWGITVALGVGFILLGAYLGLEKANQISGVASAVFGMFGVSLGIHQIFSAHANANAATQSQQAGANSVNMQAGRDITLGDSNQIGT